MPPKRNKGPRDDFPELGGNRGQGRGREYRYDNNYHYEREHERDRGTSYEKRRREDDYPREFYKRPNYGGPPPNRPSHEQPKRPSHEQPNRPSHEQPKRPSHEQSNRPPQQHQQQPSRSAPQSSRSTPQHSSSRMSVDEAPTSSRGGNGSGGAIPKSGGNGGSNGGRGGGTNGGNGSQSVDAQRGARRGNRAICDLVRTRPENQNSKKGSSGTQITLTANYFKLASQTKWNLYKYRVDFSPDIETTFARKAVMRRQMPKLGQFLFDGTMIFSPFRYQNDPTQLVDRDANDQPLQITIKFAGELLYTDFGYMQVLNIIMRTAIEKLHLVKAYGTNGMRYFDPQQTIELRAHNLQIMPGFSNSIRQHETQIMICTELTHKVIRMDTCYSALQRIGARDRDAVMRELVGKTIVTEYNNQTYRIDDIDFSQNASSTFKLKSGEDISFLQYFRDKYNITIRDTKQVLLVSRPKAKDVRGGRNEVVNLIPELCRFTGLTDEMRSNFRLMSDMAQHTRINPDRRVAKYLEFNRRIRNEPQSVEVLNKWQMRLEPELVQLAGRVLPAEKIVFGNRECEPRFADWTGEITKNILFQSGQFKNWHCICTQRDHNTVRAFMGIMMNLARDMKVQMSEPRFITIQDVRVNSYLQALDGVYNDSSQMVMVVMPTLDAHRYGSIKKQTLCRRPMPSQGVLTKVLQKEPRVLRTVAAKILIQMNCKIGNAPWTVKFPLSDTMTVGFDVTYDTTDKSKSYGALVATMDLRRVNSYYSTVSQHRHGEEMSNFLVVNMLKALKQYEQVHQSVPKRIIFYRDGVGEGDISHVREFEVQKLRDDLRSMYKERAPLLTFIIVTKRINTRLFTNMRGQISNPPPGTVVDDVITLPERYDFFIVSQSTKQGTISPTNYNVIFDESGLPPDRIQLWTYKMTHLYYNWSGNVKVPAVCQYAHKLAFLVGQYVHQLPSEECANLLYFL